MRRTQGFRTLSVPNLLKTGLGLEPCLAEKHGDVKRRTSSPCYPSVKASRPSISAPRFYLSRSPLEGEDQGPRKFSQSSLSPSVDTPSSSSESSNAETASLSSEGSIKHVLSDGSDGEFTQGCRTLNGNSTKKTLHLRRRATLKSTTRELNLALPEHALDLNEDHSYKNGGKPPDNGVREVKESDKPTAGICALSSARCQTNVGPFSTCLFNKLSSLLNVTHVCHVYKGLLALTDVLDGRISFVGRSGRVVSEFVAEVSSEPWAACVTPTGYLAVTFRRLGCVIVWSGKGRLVREFGYDVLTCPTGIACDRRGRFVVTDDKSNLVALFTPSGQFLKYLTGPDEKVRTTKEVFLGDSEAEVKDRRGEGDEMILSSPFNDSSLFGVRKPSEVKFNVQNQAKHGGTSATAKDETVLLEKQKAKVNCIPQDNADVNVCMEPVVDDSVCSPYVFSHPRYVCIAPSDKIIVSDSGSHSLKIFDSDGHFLRAVGGFGSGDGQLKAPYGVCCDQHDNIFVADYYNDRVSMFALDGMFLQHVLTPSSGLYRPKSVAVRSAHNRKLYVAHGGLRSTEMLMYRLLGKDNTKKSVTLKLDV